MRVLHVLPTIVSATVALQMAGCGSKPTTGPAASRADASQAADAARPPLSTAEVLRERLTGTNNGLELRRWTVLESPDRLMTVLAQHAEGAAAPEPIIERLKRNGFRFARVPVDALPAVLAELGGATVDRNEWHGQVYDWRSLMEQPIDARGQAVAIDGRVRRFDRGEFRLLIRSWTVQMENGPYMHLEALPQHRLPRANNLRRLIGEKPQDAGEAFPTLALDLQLEAGHAYVLVSESPQVDWPELDGPAANDGSGAASSDSLRAQPPVSRRGPPGDLGPEAGAPMTLGELLLPLSTSPPTRQVLVFVPKIPHELFPPVYESDRLHGQGRLGPDSTIAQRESDR